jgi:hypothetical protein
MNVDVMNINWCVQAVVCDDARATKKKIERENDEVLQLVGRD